MEALSAETLNVEDGSEVIVNSWMDEYGDLFRAVAMEKTMMATLLLVVAIAASISLPVKS